MMRQKLNKGESSWRKIFKPIKRKNKLYVKKKRKSKRKDKRTNKENKKKSGEKDKKTSKESVVKLLSNNRISKLGCKSKTLSVKFKDSAKLNIQ